MPDKKPLPVLLSPIPSEFHSFETGKPIERCLMCDKYLLEQGTQYLLEKAVRRYKGFDTHDVVFEYAICMDCAEKTRKMLSEESKQRIEEYFRRHVDLEERHREMTEGNTSASRWMERCMIKGTPSSEMEEYQIMAHCDGNSMLTYHFPYLIGGEAIEELNEMLSEKTKDVMDDFRQTYFGLPPELSELTKGPRLIFI